MGSTMFCHDSLTMPGLWQRRTIWLSWRWRTRSMSNDRGRVLVQCIFFLNHDSVWLYILTHCFLGVYIYIHKVQRMQDALNMPFRSSFQGKDTVRFLGCTWSYVLLWDNLDVRPGPLKIAMFFFKIWWFTCVIVWPKSVYICTNISNKIHKNSSSLFGW